MVPRCSSVFLGVPPVEVIEPSVIYEAKDGKYGEDGSETYEG